MKMVRRYDFEQDYEAEGVAAMVERQNGDYVLNDDYDAVVEERDALKVIIADAIERLREPKSP